MLCVKGECGRDIAYLFKRETVQEPPILDVLGFEYTVLVPASGGDFDDIALKGEGEEVDDGV